MKYSKSILSILFLVFVLTSCSTDDNTSINDPNINTNEDESENPNEDSYYIELDVNGEHMSYSVNAFSMVNIIDNWSSSIFLHGNTDIFDPNEIAGIDISFHSVTLDHSFSVGTGEFSVTNGISENEDYLIIIELSLPGNTEDVYVSTNASLTIDEITDEYVSGTFQAQLIDPENPVVVITHNITNGMFKLEREY